MMALGASGATAASTAGAIGSIGAGIGTAVSAVGGWAPVAAGVLSAGGAIYSGVQAENNAKIEAKQMKEAGEDEFATSQRRALIKKREMDLARSSLRAKAGASGTYGGDIDAMDVGIIQQGNYNQMVEFYSGKSSLSKAYASSYSTLKSGKNAMSSSLIKAAGSGMGSYYDIYRKT